MKVTVSPSRQISLRKIYGQSFASGFAETAKLSEVLRKEPAHASLTQLRKDHVAGSLEGKIKQHA